MTPIQILRDWVYPIFLMVALVYLALLLGIFVWHIWRISRVSGLIQLSPKHIAEELDQTNRELR
jgi:hypothetical protein